MSTENCTTKTCSKCKRELPATRQYFYMTKGRCQSRCKDCKAVDMGYKRRRNAYEGCTDGCKRCTKCGKEYPANTDNYPVYKRTKDGLNSHCWECVYEGQRLTKAKWFENHQEESNLRSKKFHKKNPEYGKEYNAKHRQRVNENMREWRKRNPERWRELAQISKAKRDFAKRNLPNNFTDEDWYKCKEWFNNQCAFCGEIKPLTLDHYIPYYNLLCPGNVPHNIIPLCKSCNSSKNKRVASDWLLKTFGKAKAIAIMQLIEKYFQSLKDG